MVDKAEEGSEAETDEEHHRLRFREVSAPPRNTPFLQARMALINLAKGWMLPMPVRLGRCMFVPVILSLASPSRFSLNGGSVRYRASVAPAVTPWWSSQRGQDTDLYDLVFLRMRVANEKLLYRN
jgi:hypothetical protein